MPFNHEKLDVYQLSLKAVKLIHVLCRERSEIQRSSKEQLFRAAQSIPLNIAEGNGKATPNDRRRYFEIARGSAHECAAVLDVLAVCEHVPIAEMNPIKDMFDRISAMLTKLGGRGYLSHK